MTTTLVFGDPHAGVEHNNDRFDWAGNMIVDLAPDNLVQMGDFGNLDSVSFHERGQPRLQEGRRLIDDLCVMGDAYRRMFDPLDDYNERRMSNKKRMYTPNIYWLEGNHEERVKRYLHTEPIMEGIVPETDLVGAASRGAIIVPYRHFAYIEGVIFTHAVQAERASIALGGKYVGARVCEAVQSSCVYGHHHHRQFHSITRVDAENPDGKVVNSLCAGMYADYYPDYMKDNKNRSNWWSGAILLHHTEYGDFDYECFSMARVREYWG